MSMRLPLLLALASGGAIGAALYADGYFPQNDVFAAYQIFHYVYSSVLLDGQVPLWQPYASYGLPHGYEMAFTFGPTEALMAVVGVLLRVSDIKLLFFASVGLNYAMIGIAAAFLVRELTGSSGAPAAFAAVALPLSQHMETHPLSYQFAQAVLFAILFLVRFVKTRRGVWLTAGGLALVANVYGEGQYLAVPQFYCAALFALMAGWRYRKAMAAEWRSMLRSMLTVPALALAALTAVLAAGLLLIDHEILQTLSLTARARDTQSLVPTLDTYLHYLYARPIARFIDVVNGRPISGYDVLALHRRGQSGSAALCPCSRLEELASFRSF